MSEDETVKRLLGYSTCFAGGTLLALAGQPGYATATVITGVEIIPTDRGAQVVLKTESGETPQIFAINLGETLRADIVRTQLNLPNGETFVQQNPVPGIQEIAVAPLDGNSVRLTVNGNNLIPMGTVGETANGNIVIDIETQTTPPQATTPVPENLVTVPGPETVAQPQVASTPETPDTTSSMTPVEAAEGLVAQADPDAPAPDVLVPNPEVIIDGVPVPAPQVQQAPPFLPAAVPPPVGDIAVAESNVDFRQIDLGTNERVPRLVLRDAPSREVLTLLARAAGLNLVFIDTAAGAPGETGTAGVEGTTPTGEGPPITLDIENESVQDVFNSVLRVSGLQANRVGRTIYVGPALPDAARNIVSRTLRLNQVDASTAAGYLASLGAEATQVVTVTTFNDLGADIGTTETQGEGETLESRLRFTESATETQIRPLTLETDQDTGVARILRGLLVTSDERTNAVTLVGEPELVDKATEYLALLDLRNRQVAINLKVIDVNLNSLDALGTSFSLSIGDTSIVSSGGLGTINFGTSSPFTTTNPVVPEVPPILPDFLGPAGNFDMGNFLIQLFATVREGNSKVLTDPTLIVQEGQTASVALTEQIVSRITQQVTDIGDSAVITTEPELVEAGLALTIAVDRIDDNGFVSLNVSPTLSAPVTTVPTGGDTFVTLLNTRQLSSGVVRVRDGQTLVLSGIIQEADRTTVTKVPILGDLPLLGALFRSTVQDNERRELIVLLTPEILDDTDQSVFGYSYTPSAEVQELIDRSRNRSSQSTSDQLNDR